MFLDQVNIGLYLVILMEMALQASDMVLIAKVMWIDHYTVDRSLQVEVIPLKMRPVIKYYL